MTNEYWTTLHRDALAGKTKARQALMRALWPIVHHQVGQVLLANRWLLGRRSIRQEAEELTQHVFLQLMKDGDWVLRKWSSNLGRSLPNFIRRFAKWQTYSVLRTHKRWPWIDGELGAEEAALAERPDVGACPEGIAGSRELAELIRERAKARLTPFGWTMFEMIIVEELATEEICRLTGMSPGSVHVWGNRLRVLIRQIIAEQEKN